MASLRQRKRLTGFALALAVALTILPGIIAPLAGVELDGWLSGAAEVMADEAHGGGG